MSSLASRQRQVRCNKCDALPGQPCVSKSGKRLSHVHSVRKQRAKRTGMDRGDLPKAYLRKVASDEQKRRDAGKPVEDG